MADIEANVCPGGGNLSSGYDKVNIVGEKQSGLKFFRESLANFNNLVKYVNYQVQSGVDHLCPPQPVDEHDNNNTNNNNNNNNILPTSDEASTRKEETSPPRPLRSVKRTHIRRSPTTTKNSGDIESTCGVFQALLLLLCTGISKGRGALYTILKHVLYQSSASCCITKLYWWVTICLVFTSPQVAAANVARNVFVDNRFVCEDEDIANATIVHRSEAFAQDWLEWVMSITVHYQLIYFGGIILAAIGYFIYSVGLWPKRIRDRNRLRVNIGTGYEDNYRSRWLQVCPAAIPVQGGPLLADKIVMAVKQESLTELVLHLLIVGCHGSTEVTQSHLKTAIVISFTAPVQDSKSITSYYSQKSQGMSVIEAIPSFPDKNDTSVSVSVVTKGDDLQDVFQPSQPVQCGHELTSVIPVADVQVKYKSSRKAINSPPSSTFLVCNQDGLVLPSYIHHQTKNDSKVSDDSASQEDIKESPPTSSEDNRSTLSSETTEDESTHSSLYCEEDFYGSDVSGELGRYGQITHASYSTSNTVFVYVASRITHVEVQALALAVSSHSTSDYNLIKQIDPAHGGKTSKARPQVEEYSPCCFDATLQQFVAQYTEEENSAAEAPN